MGRERRMSESATEAEDGIMDALEHGEMTKDEVYNLIKKEYKLKRYEFNSAWESLQADGEIKSVGGKKYKRT